MCGGAAFAWHFALTLTKCGCHENAELKGGSAAKEGGTEVPHSKVSVIGSGICVADQTYQRGLTQLMCLGDNIKQT